MSKRPTAVCLDQHKMVQDLCVVFVGFLTQCIGDTLVDACAEIMKNMHFSVGCHWFESKL